MPSAGRKKVIDTPEFQNAVNTRVEEAMAKFKAEMLAHATPGVVAPVSSDSVDLLGEVLSKLSMNMAAIGQQGQRQRPLSPEEVAAREAAHNRMVDLILATREPGAERPAYKLIAKTYLNERFLEPFRMNGKVAVPTEITYTGVPNDAMVPLNKAAEGIFAAWRGTTGGPTVLVPTADTRPYWVTSSGLVVKGDPPKRQHVAAEAHFEADLSFPENSSLQGEVAVLGTVARKARTNAVQGVS